MQRCSNLPNCSALDGTVDCIFQSDPDISGTGILLSFVISAAVAFLIAAVGLLFTASDTIATSKEQERRLFLGALADTRQSWVVDLDQIFYNDSHRLLRPLRQTLTWRRKLLTRQAVQTVSLILSDQALISGVAVLSVALAQRMTISEYHYSIIATEANVAFTVLQSSTLLLNGYFSDNVFRGAWRAVVATIFAILLLVDTVVSGHKHWLDSFGTPVQCVYNTLGTQFTRDPAVIVSILIQCILIYTGWLQCVRVLAPSIFRMSLLIKLMLYPVRILTCALPASKAITRRRNAADTTSSRRLWTAARIALYPLVLITLLLGSVTHSKLFSMVRIGILLISGSASLFASRTFAPYEGQDGDDTSWGFGQALAIFMLALPLFNAAEVWTDVLRDKDGPDSPDTSSPDATDLKTLDYGERIRRASRSSQRASPLHDHGHPDLSVRLPRIQTDGTTNPARQNFSSVTEHFTFRVALYLLLLLGLMAGGFVVYTSAQAANGTD